MDKNLSWLFLFILSASGGLMLNLAWAPHHHTYLAFFALLPFLAVASRFKQYPLGVFLSLYFGFFLFHASAARWMYSSTIAGSLIAHMVNAFLPAFVLTIWAVFPSGANQNLKVFILIALWLSMEWLNEVWQIAWPWFQLGHVFGSKPQWVQWYGFTSSSGGTVWVLLVNYLILRSLEPFPKTHYPCLLSGFLLIALPVLLSPIVQAPTNDGHKVTLAIVQPNIHPQKEKFGGMDADAQFSKAIRLLDAADTKSLEIVVFPETMIVDPIDEALIDESVYVRTLREIMKDLGLTSVFIGAFTKRHTGWHPSDDASVIASSPPFVLYNSLLLVRRDSIDVYHKEKLVPLVEKQPFQWLMKPLRSFIERSGAFFGSYGTYNRRHQLTIDEQHAAVPLICFESAFSCFPQPSPMASFVVLVTNDGWWSSSGGYIQHLNLARLRAIERGQWIARAANTGISGVINPRGEIVGSIDYNSEGILIAEVPYSFNNDRISFSVQKWMRWTALGFLVAVLFFNAVKRLRF